MRHALLVTKLNIGYKHLKGYLKDTYGAIITSVNIQTYLINI